MSREELPTRLREMVYMLDIPENSKNPALKGILRKMREAANEIESLQSQLAQVTAERDAAVMEIEQHIKSDIDNHCYLCAYYADCEEIGEEECKTKSKWRGPRREVHI